MEDINTIALSGNLVKDSDVKTFEKSSLLNFTIACNRSKKNGDNWESTPVFVDVKYWSSGASKMAEYLKKGVSVFVSGAFDCDRYKDKDTGANVTRYYVAANNIRWNIRGEKSSDSNFENNPVSDNNCDFPSDIPF